MIHERGTRFLFARVVVTALAVAAAASVVPMGVMAQGTPTTPTEAPPPAADDNETLAKEHYRLGIEHYDRGNYEQALREFRAAYDLSKKAALFNNIYVCYERLGDLAHAEEYLKKYLDSGEVPAEERPNLERRLANLQARRGMVDEPNNNVNVDDTGKNPAGQPKAQPTAGTTGDQAAQTPPHESGTPFWTWFAAGGAVAALATGGILLAVAGGEYSDLKKQCDDEGCTQADIDASSGPAMQTVGGVLLGVGGALAVTAVVLYFVETSDSESDEAPATAFGIGPNGVSISGQF